MNLGIIANPEKYSIRESVDRITSWIRKKSHHLLIAEKLNKYCDDQEVVSILSSEENVARSSDILISVGGDGTMLWTSRLARRYQKPIVGINCGRLGFLASHSLSDIESILHLVTEGTPKRDRRYFLEARSRSTDTESPLYALNEFVVTKRDASSLIAVEAHYGQELINRYWADGVLVSTPTGSTAYNLSSGGPIVMPDTNVLVLTPINPHTLTTRPMVLPANQPLTLRVAQQSTELLFSYDSQNIEISEYPFEIEIQQSQSYIDLYTLPDHNFFTTLRNKLMWGKDIREHL